MRAAKRIGKLPYSQNIVGVKSLLKNEKHILLVMVFHIELQQKKNQLGYKEVGTCVSDFFQLQKRRSHHQSLDILIVNLDHSTVGEIDQTFQNPENVQLLLNVAEQA